MLTKLFISNYVLISRLEVDFTKGFTVITGETGAGKSILLSALSLILGERASSVGRSDSEKKIIAEGEFDISEYGLERFFTQHDLDFEPATTNLRREILPSGKSRAFVNDTPVSLSVLKELGEKLVDIHSQHENQMLLKPAYQLRFLDAFAGITDEVGEFTKMYGKWKQLRIRLTELIEKEQKARQEEDYIRFQLNELEEANLQAVDFMALQNELNVLDNAEAILAGLQGSVHFISEGEVNAVELLKQALAHLEDAAQLNEGYRQLSERLQSVRIELDDLSNEITYQSNDVEQNPDRAEQIRAQVDTVNRLLYKHGLNEVSELVQLEEKLADSLLKLEGYAEEIVEVEKQLSVLESDMKKAANTISKHRKNAAPKLESAIQMGLNNLGMPDAHLIIDLREVDEFGVTGTDEIRLLFSANKGFSPQRLEKVASGGERSRLMLVLKKIHATVSALPTLILDEIDTGVSGEIASKTAQMLNEMSFDTQIIVITHLPQVAGRASHHLKVVKNADDERAQTQLFVLNVNERKLEIARMLSGEDISTAALENAEQLMARD